MNNKSKIYIILIVLLLIIISVKPIMNSRFAQKFKGKEIEISFFEPSVKHHKFLETMKEEGCINSFKYEIYDKKAKVYLTSEQMEKASEFVLKSLDSLKADTLDNYEIEVNGSLDEVTALADCDMDFVEVSLDFRTAIEYCQIYQKLNGKDSWRCHGVIKNRETGAVISDTIQPGESITYDATLCTGIEDEKQAIYTFNHNLYTKMNYQEAVTENGVFTSTTGGFQLQIPEKALVKAKKDLNKTDELPANYTLYDIKDRLFTGVSVHELDITLNGSINLVVTPNYSYRQFDEEYYDEFIKKVVYAKLKKTYSNVKLSKTDFLGEECNVISFKEGSKYNYLVFYCKDEFSYCIWGTYKEKGDLQTLNELISSFTKTNL